VGWGGGQSTSSSFSFLPSSSSSSSSPSFLLQPFFIFLRLLALRDGINREREREREMYIRNLRRSSSKAKKGELEMGGIEMELHREIRRIKRRRAFVVFSLTMERGGTL
jgi:hypothetical protein